MKAISNIKISIIIPTYNAEQYIEWCLFSVCNQALKNIEIIVVDDGSTDNTCKIVERFGDKRIKLVKNQHLGVSNARNTGIKHATGEYIQFVDVDDTLSPNCCEIAFSNAVNHNADCVFFGTDFISEDEVPQWMIDCTNTKNRFYKKFKNEVIFDIQGTKPFIWNQIIKRSLLLKHNIRFDTSLKLGEDQAFQFAYLPYAKNIVMIESPLYNHYVYPTSATFASFDTLDEKVALHLDVVASVLKASKRHGLSFQCKTCAWAVNFIHGDYIHINNTAVSQKVNNVFSKSNKFLHILPRAEQQRAVEMNVISRIHNGFMNKVIRKLLYR